MTACAPANLDASSRHPQVILTLTASSFAFTALGLVITLCPQAPFRPASSPATDDTQIARSHRFKLSRQQHTRHLASRALARDAYYRLWDYLPSFRTLSISFCLRASLPTLDLPLIPQLSLSNVAAPCHRVLAIMRMEIIPSPGLGQREPLVNEYTAQFSPSLSVCVPIPIIRVVFFLAGDVPAVTAAGAVTLGSLSSHLTITCARESVQRSSAHYQIRLPTWTAL